DSRAPFECPCRDASWKGLYAGPVADGAHLTNDWADEAEDRLLTASVRLAPRLGWSGRLIAEAARDAGLTGPEAELLLPNGPRDLAALFSRRHDRIALDALAGLDPATLKIRERIRRGVLARCDAAAADD